MSTRRLFLKWPGRSASRRARRPTTRRVGPVVMATEPAQLMTHRAVTTSCSDVTSSTWPRRVENLALRPGGADIRRLHVPMDDAMLVSCCSPLAILRARRRCLYGRGRARRPAASRRVERHRDEQLPFGGLADPVDCADVGCQRLRRVLEQKAACRLWSRRGGAEETRATPAEPVVERLVTTPIAPERGLENEIPADGLSFPPEHR